MRVKFSIWNEQKLYWATAWCKPELLLHNINLMQQYGLKVRVG